eukprot:XP_014774225.1 PREDICTED: uncharacterized protein LOC106871957 [Octopus bimaculoides]
MNSKRIWNFIKAVTGNIPLLKNIAVYSTSKIIGNFGEIMHLMWIHLLLIMGLCEGIHSCPDMYSDSPQHVACLPPSPFLMKSVEVDTFDKKLILFLHNKYREDIKPGACAMFQLKWNEELAFLAQKWANNCEYQKSEREYNDVPGKYSLVQNIGLAYVSWGSVVNAWHAEINSFNYTYPGEGVADSYRNVLQFVMGLCEEFPHCPSNCKQNSDHTACLPPSPNLMESVEVDKFDKKLILFLHNKYREDIKPGACAMFQLKCNVELAFLAQKWTNNCEYQKNLKIKMVLATIYFILLLMSHSGLSEAYCSEQFRIRGGHTACLEKSPKLKESLIVTDVQKSIIIALHNVIRVKVQPPSCNMFRMHWDYELAYLAQKWSDNCVLKNDEILNRSIPLKYNVGQNIAAKFSKWYDVIRYWRSEGKDFKYGRKHSKNTAQYTQLVWATSILIGCGASLCSNIGTFYVCNYAPAGNINGEEPYRRCNKTRSLRDCGHNACYNFGILNVEDCSCSCYEHSHTYGHNCLLNCSFSDISIKCKKIPVDYCHYAHLRPSCPWLCKECSIASWSQRTNWFLLFVVQIFIPGLTMCSN